MRRPLQTLVLVSLLLLVIVTPPKPAPSPVASLATSASSAFFDWSNREASNLNARKHRELSYLFSQSVSQPKKPKTQQSEQSQFVAHFEPGSVQQLIVDIFGPTAPAALTVAKCESGFDPSATNGHYRGVFQVGDLHAANWLDVTGQDYWASWMDPVVNITYAYSLSKGGTSWGPWSCKP